MGILFQVLESPALQGQAPVVFGGLMVWNGLFLGIGIGAGVVGGWAKSGESFALAGANAGGACWIDGFGKAFK